LEEVCLPLKLQELPLEEVVCLGIPTKIFLITGCNLALGVDNPREYRPPAIAIICHLSLLMLCLNRPRPIVCYILEDSRVRPATRSTTGASLNNNNGSQTTAGVLTSGHHGGTPPTTASGMKTIGIDGAGQGLPRVHQVGSTLLDSTVAIILVTTAVCISPVQHP